MTSVNHASKMPEDLTGDYQNHAAPETAFEGLLTLCRAYLNRSDCPKFPARLWQEIASLATLHRLGPVVWKMIADSNGGAPLSDSLPDLRKEVKLTSRWSLFLTSELLRIMDGLQKRGIVAVPLKGPALAQELYGDVSMRVFSDLDLLTSPASLPATLDALYQAGYRLRSHRPDPPGEKLIKWFVRIGRGEIPLVHPQKDVQVDLHWHLLDKALGARLPPHRTLAPKPLMIAGRPIPHLRMEDLLLFLSLHGFKHGWLRLNWLLDLALLIRDSSESLDFAFIRSRIYGTEVKAALAVGLTMAWELLGEGKRDLVKGLLQERDVSRGKKIASGLVRDLEENPWDTEEAPRSKVLPLLMAANPGLWRKGRRLLHLLGALGYEDIDALRLPAWPLVPYLYYPSRCLRLFGKFAPRIGRVR